MNPAREAQLVRAQQIVELALLGATIAETSAILDIPDEVVRRVLMIEDSDRPTRQRVQRERLEDLLLAHVGKALRGDPRATQTVIKILEREATLLGLDEPRRSEIDTTITKRLEPDLSATTSDELAAMLRVLDDVRADAAIDVTPKRLTNGKTNGHT